MTSIHYPFFFLQLSLMRASSDFLFFSIPISAMFSTLSGILIRLGKD
ncbi:MAG: hypothetical protein ACTSVI_00185 [Promethearchaeota archaeon]